MATVQGVQIGGLRRVNHVKCHGLRCAAWHFEITVISMTIIEGFGKQKKIVWGQLKPWFVCAERFPAERSQVNRSVGFFCDVLSLRAAVREGPTSCYQAHANCTGWMWKSLILWKDALKQLPNVFSVQVDTRQFVKCTSGCSSLCFVELTDAHLSSVIFF